MEKINKAIEIEPSQNATDLALDNEQLRQLNTKKIVNTFEKVGDYVEEQRKTAKTTKYYLLGMMLIFGFLLLGGIMIVAYKSGGVERFIDNFWITDNLNQRIICFDEKNNFTFRDPRQAYFFMEVINNSNCSTINLLKD